MKLWHCSQFDGRHEFDNRRRWAHRLDVKAEIYVQPAFTDLIQTRPEIGAKVCHFLKEKKKIGGGYAVVRIERHGDEFSVPFGRVIPLEAREYDIRRGLESYLNEH